MTKKPRHITFAVSNDLTFDQRMMRICRSLRAQGYAIRIVGRSKGRSVPLRKRSYEQRRFSCFFQRGFGFYAEYNIRLFFYLLFAKTDVIGAVDLDTMPACFLASRIRNRPLVFDAHEYFTEVPELLAKKRIRRFWEWLADRLLPRSAFNYTVSDALRSKLEARYGHTYAVIRNFPYTKALPEGRHPSNAILIYQGVLNAGRGLHLLIDVVGSIPEATLWLVGEGDLSDSLRAYAAQKTWKDHIVFHGLVEADALHELTIQARIGINVLDDSSPNYVLSLANKFLDYVQAGIPSINMAFPEYVRFQVDHETSVLIQDLTVADLRSAIERLLHDEDEYERLRANCLRARLDWCWEKEELRLIEFYRRWPPHTD